MIGLKQRKKNQGLIMKYIDFEKNVAAFEDGRYEARIDRAKQNVEN